MWISDTTLWAAARDAAASTGWESRDLVLDTATDAICNAHDLHTDEARETIRGRLDALWIRHMSIMDAV